MRTVARQVAFEKDEFVDEEGLRRETSSAFQVRVDFTTAAAFPASQRNMWMKGAAFGLEASRLACALDLGCKRGDWRFGFDAGPQRARTALLEAADAGDV